jgi:hypothetical protein
MHRTKSPTAVIGGLRIGEAELGRTVEHGVDPTHAIGDWPQIAASFAIEMLLYIHRDPAARNTG